MCVLYECLQLIEIITEAAKDEERAEQYVAGQRHVDEDIKVTTLVKQV